MKAVLDGKIRIAQADGIAKREARLVEDADQRKVHPDLTLPERAVAEFHSLRILSQVGKGTVREKIVLVVGFDVPMVQVGHVRVVGIERLLSTGDGARSEH